MPDLLVHMHWADIKTMPDASTVLNLPDEVWCDVPEYESMYQISNFGRARSKDRVRYQKHVSGKTVPHVYKGKIISLDYSSSELGILNVYNMNKKQSFSMYQLMCKLFGQEYSDLFYFSEYIPEQLDGEIWRSIEGYSDLYQVSTRGRVKRLCTDHSIILKPWYNEGYQVVALSKHNVSTSYLVHRLVASTFIPNPENKPEVNHIDGVKDNNCVENLEWVSKSENMQHAYDNNLINFKSEEKRKCLDLGMNKVRVPIRCIELNREFSSILQASKELNISYSKISYACSNESRTHRTSGYTFERIYNE